MKVRIDKTHPNNLRTATSMTQNELSPYNMSIFMDIYDYFNSFYLDLYGYIRSFLYTQPYDAIQTYIPRRPQQH